jgi:hypothetical protein
MNAGTIIKTVVQSTPHVSILALNIFWVYLTLGYRVRRTRRAFEQQLILQGMQKQDAKRLSACYKELSDNITGMVKQNIRFRSVD